MTTFRSANAADAQAIVELVTSAYRGDSSRAGWTTEADLLDGARIDQRAVEADIAAPGTSIELAFDGADLLGCVQVQTVGDGLGYLGMFAIQPGLQGRGLGKELLAHAEAVMADRWGVERVEMKVISVRAELIAFYQRRGYALTGELRPFPYGDAAFGDPQRQDLEFAVLEKGL